MLVRYANCPKDFVCLMRLAGGVILTDLVCLQPQQVCSSTQPIRLKEVHFVHMS